MPHGKRKGRRSKKTYRVSTRRLASKRVDTLVERRMQEISKAEIEKQKVTLILRKQWFGTYNASTNAFGPGTRIDYGGLITQLSDIPVVDIEFVQNNAAADNPLSVQGMGSQPFGSAPNEAADGDGVGQGQSDLAPHGRRQSAQVRCKSVTVGVRIYVPPMETDDDASFPDYDGCWLHLAVVAVRSANNSIAGNVGWPQPASVLTMPRFSYDRFLDPIEDNNSAHVKFRTILKEKVFMPFSNAKCNVKFKEWTRKYTKILQYHPEDQNGENCLKDKLFLVLRSDIPAGIGESHTKYKPVVTAFTKLRYYDI